MKPPFDVSEHSGQVASRKAHSLRGDLALETRRVAMIMGRGINAEAVLLGVKQSFATKGAAHPCASQYCGSRWRRLQAEQALVEAF